MEKIYFSKSLGFIVQTDIYNQHFVFGNHEFDVHNIENVLKHVSASCNYDTCKTCLDELENLCTMIVNKEKDVAYIWLHMAMICAQHPQSWASAALHAGLPKRLPKKPKHWIGWEMDSAGIVKFLYSDKVRMGQHLVLC